MAKYKADIDIGMSVEFEDNGIDSLPDQAIEAAMEQYNMSPLDFDKFEVTGPVVPA